ncbi:MAG: response regulator [Proteobacteria bacterium]|nr:response regulator [Desulfocapsa sp.]MBU3944591.1 response regulator [Pseudomonadota bacterium]MCG2744647.1 response regulator [Desulfobacteraceae bacterium]MBU3984727.1 response regulator [Pseudomonadota bacterium]MBU4029647.1 response regulator [Pseudomonadota bacterium]
MVRETILIVEDDENIQQLVGYNLAKAGFNVLYADNGEQALASVKRELPDLMVLDIMLPSLNGFEVCKILRKDPQTRTMPIIMLTAKSEENDVTAGLDLGADDYITKPFSPKILVSRIKSILRRREELSGEDGREAKDGLLKVHDIVIDPKRYEVVVAGSPVSLTVTEFSILDLLARRPGWVFSRQQIIDGVRGYDYVITPRAVDVQVFGLRKKLGASGECIETVRGIGYRMKG